MALTFSGTNKVDHGSGATLDNLPNTSGGYSGGAWVFRTSDGSNQFVFGKNGAAFEGWQLAIDSAPAQGVLVLLIWLSTDFSDLAQVTSNASNVVPLNSWRYVGWSWNFANTPRGRLFLGTMTPGSVIEVTGYDNQAGGVASTVVNDAAVNLSVGNANDGTVPFLGRIDSPRLASGVTWTAADHEAHARMTQKSLGDDAAVVLCSPYRAGDVADYSGNANNGTITGATNSDGPWVSALSGLLAPIRQTAQIIGR